MAAENKCESDLWTHMFRFYGEVGGLDAVPHDTLITGIPLCASKGGAVHPR